MDADGTGFTFPPAADFSKGTESSDISWGDIFLDGIHSDDQSALEKLAGDLDVPTETPGPPLVSQQVIQQQPPQQQGMMGGQVHIQMKHQRRKWYDVGNMGYAIPTHLQGTLPSNGLQQTSTSLSGTVAYLAPSVTSSHMVSSANNLQNVMPAGGQRLVTASVPQQAQQAQTQQQPNAKLVQLTSNFPVASVQQLTNSVPLQTLLQSNQPLTNQTIYRSQSGLFPTQGSVHIENPKVVNVNFGPHLIGSDGSSQQAYIQTAEGKPVFITNSQLQQMSQSLNLTQPLVSTQLLNQAGGNMLRTSLAQGAQQPVNSQPRQIVLPSGQTVIPRQPEPAAKNVVLRQINPTVPPVIYPGGQAGQLQLQPQSAALIASSGQGLQVVNAGAGQTNQVQLIAQPQLGQGQQQLNQSTIMNLLNGQGVLNNGLVSSGQNILVNGQVVNLSQLGGLAMQQLQLQQQQQPQQQTTVGGGMGMTLGQSTVVSRPVGNQLQQQQQQLQNQTTTQQQLFLRQNGSGGVGVVRTNSQQQQQQQMPTQIMLQQQQQQQKLAVGLTTPLSNLQQGTFKPAGSVTPSNAGSNCSTPAPTPTPSTPTPTPTPDLMLDPSASSGGKGNQSINILEQALSMSQIDLNSFEDDFNLLSTPDECLLSVSSTPAPPVAPVAPPKPKAKRQTKKSKAASQPSAPAQQQQQLQQQQQQLQQQQKAPTAQLQNTQGQKVTIGPQQKLITTNGQVYVLSANGQQLILQQPSTTTVTTIAPQLKPIPSQSAPTVVSTTPSGVKAGALSSAAVQPAPRLLLAQSNNFQTTPSVRQQQQKASAPGSRATSQQQKKVFVTASMQSDNKVYVKAGAETALTVGPNKLLLEPSPPHPEPISSAQFSVTVSGPANQDKLQKVTTLGGSFVKQEPLTAVVKQEPLAALEQVPSLLLSAQTPVATTSPAFTPVSKSSAQAVSSGSSSNVVPVSSSLVVSTSVTSPATTQSHQSTIMVSSPSVGTSAAAATSTTTASSSTSTTTSKSSSKERDPNNVKTMTPIKINDSTLMLSLTPVQKERLEKHLSKMSVKEQNQFRDHQLNLTRWIHQVQQEHQQKFLQKQQQDAHKQQHQQQVQQQQQLQQKPSPKPQPNQQAAAAATVCSSSVQQRLSNQQQKQQACPGTPQQKQVQQPAQASADPALSAHANVDSTPSFGLPTTVEELENERLEKKTPQRAPAARATHEQLVQQPKQSLAPAQQAGLPPQQQPPQAATVQQTAAAATSASQTPVQQLIYPQLGRCLAEQQLLRDRSLALNPDTHTPFKNLSDAMRRLVRYHTLQDHKPEEDSKTITTWDTKYSKLCDYLMKKKRYYMRRYNKLRLYHDMCQHGRPESLQNLLCFNEQLSELFEAEKEEAKNHPDTFQPVRPVERAPSPVEQRLLASPATSPERTTPAMPRPREERRAIKKAWRKEAAAASNSNAIHFKQPTVKEEVLGTRIKHEVQTSPKPFSNLKRKSSPERGSSGTLKLVFKRRTTDDFSVKNSVELSQAPKPVVNVDKSDSEYELDVGASSRSEQSVKVRGQASSQSRQTSLDGASDHSSVEHFSDRASENSEESEDEEKEEDDEDSQSGSGDDDEEEYAEEGEDDEEEEYYAASGDESRSEELEESCDGDKKSSKKHHRVSFEDTVEDPGGRNGGDTGGDAFMETDEPSFSHNPEGKDTVFEGGKKNPLSSIFKFSDISSIDCETLSSGGKSGRILSKSASVASAVSDDVFSTAAVSDCGATEDFTVGRTGTFSGQERSPHPVSSESAVSSAMSIVTSAPVSHHPTFQSMHPLQSPPLRARVSELSSALGVSSIEKEAASRGLPSSSILNTPSKSLLQTDAMFNSSDDEEEEDGMNGSSHTRVVSRFKIDNRDPQNSMINDSVRSAIDSVLNDEDSNGHEGEDSQTSWSSAHRASSSASSSVVHNGIFRLSSSSPSLHPNNDTDLDSAVQSILNS